MKKLVLFFFAALSFQANATVHTVNNNPNGGTAFKQINEAIEVAVSGDTIYVQGSVTTYEGFTLTDKRIVFVGSGFAPSKELPQLTTIVGGQVRNTAAIGSSNGTEFNGFIITQTISFSDSFQGSGAVNDIVVRRCHIKGSLNIGGAGGAYTNYLIESNYFNGGFMVANSGSNYSGFIIKNNLFRPTLNGAFRSFVNAADILFDHNLFYSDVAADAFLNCTLLTLTNNIFYKVNAGVGVASLSATTFKNNIAFASSNTTPWVGADNIDGGGNLSVDPKIVANTAVNAGTDNPLLDFSVGAGPAKNAGLDGKDIGLLFEATGSLNWRNANAPRLPFIFSMNILNSTVAPGTNLNVEVTAKKQN